MSEGKENEENAQPRKRLPTLGARPRIHSKLARFPRARLHAARPKSGQVTVPLKRTLEQKNDAFAYYSVLYTKRSKKKHKTYQDGLSRALTVLQSFYRCTCSLPNYSTLIC